MNNYKLGGHWGGGERTVACHSTFILGRNPNPPCSPAAAAISQCYSFHLSSGLLHLPPSCDGLFPPLAPLCPACSGFHEYAHSDLMMVMGNPWLSGALGALALLGPGRG